MPNSLELNVSPAQLHTFANHPFHVRKDLEMNELVDSIRESGVIVPLIVRSRPEGGYEIISGHRRCEACRELGIEKVPVRVQELTDDEATILMVNSISAKSASGLRGSLKPFISSPTICSASAAEPPLPATRSLPPFSYDSSSKRYAATISFLADSKEGYRSTNKSICLISRLSSSRIVVLPLLFQVLFYKVLQRRYRHSLPAGLRANQSSLTSGILTRLDIIFPIANHPRL